MNIDSLLTDFEKRLMALERTTLLRFENVLLEARKQLERELAPLYRYALEEVETLPRRDRRVRAERLLMQIDGLLGFLPPDREDTLAQLVSKSSLLGTESGKALLRAFDPSGTPFSRVPLRATLNAVYRATKHLEAHGEEFAARVGEHIAAGLVYGASWRKTARLIALEGLGFRRNIERIVVTESVAALDRGHREAYLVAGIRHFQWSAALDRRVCPYCAARHSLVWDDESFPNLPAHPYCRCRRLPWKPEWQAQGLTGDARYARQRTRMGELLATRGLQPLLQRTSFDPKGAIKEPFWSPDG